MSSRARRIFVVVVAATLASCGGPRNVAPPAPLNPIALAPPSAAPGDSVRITHAGGDFKTRPGLEVIVGGKHAAIVRVPDDDHIDFIVPIVASDSAEVTVGDENGPFGRSLLMVTEPPTVLVILAVSDTLSMVHTAPSLDSPTGNVVSNEQRLSFDLVDGSAHLIHRCSVLDPLHTPGEALVPGSSTTQVMVTRRGFSSNPVVVLRLPRVAGPVKLRAFRVPAGLNITTPGGLAQRTLINELVLSF